MDIRHFDFLCIEKTNILLLGVSKIKKRKVVDANERVSPDENAMCWCMLIVEFSLRIKNNASTCVCVCVCKRIKFCLSFASSLAAQRHWFICAEGGELIRPKTEIKININCTNSNNRIVPEWIETPSPAVMASHCHTYLESGWGVCFLKLVVLQTKVRVALNVYWFTSLGQNKQHTKLLHSDVNFAEISVFAALEKK